MSSSLDPSAQLQQLTAGNIARPTPDPTHGNPPIASSPLANASPLLQPGDENANLDLHFISHLMERMEEDAPPDENPEPGEEKGEPEVPDGLDDIVAKYYTETPNQRTVGRTGFNRVQMVVKLAILHQFGMRCLLSLTCFGLQLAHVIPVHAPPHYLAFLEWVFGDVARTLNRNSCRNFWLVEGRLHYAIDRGIIKVLPAMDILEAILRFSEEVREKHAGKRTNDNIGLNRREVFPPGNYSYTVVGILCSPRYLYARERLLEPVDMEAPQGSIENQIYDFSYQPHPYPIPQSPWAKDSEQHLKGYTTDLSNGNAFATCIPTQSSPDLHFHGWQDPWLVTANVGELLKLIREEREKNGVAFQIEDLVHDQSHQDLLRLCLQIYDYWLEDPGPPPATEPSRKGKERATNDTTFPAGEAETDAAVPSQPRPRTRSQTARSNAGKPEPKVEDTDEGPSRNGPATRTRSRGAPSTADKTEAPPTKGSSRRTRSKGGRSNVGNTDEGAAAAPEPGPSRPRRAASKTGSKKSGSKAGSKAGSKKGKP